MINLKKSFQVISRVVAIALLVSTIWMFSLPTFSALADSDLPFGSANYQHTDLTAGDSNIAKARKQRIDVVDDCRKYLIKGDKDTPAQLDRPLDLSGSKTVAPTLKVNDKPEPTVAEVQFKRCLEEKGISPKP